MSFVLTVISQNSSTEWNASLGGNAIVGAYYQSITVMPFLSNGPVVNFPIADDVDATCTIDVTVEAMEF